MSDVPESENEDTALQSTGGEGGRTVLSRSELAILRRCADRYPLIDADRRRAVELTLEAMEQAKSVRGKLIGVKTLVELDRVNLAEIALFLQMQKQNQPVATHAPAVQVNVNAGDGATVNVKGVLDDYRDVLAGTGVPRIAASGDSAGESVHPAGTDQAAGEVPS